MLNNPANHRKQQTLIWIVLSSFLPMKMNPKPRATCQPVHKSLQNKLDPPSAPPAIATSVSQGRPKKMRPFKKPLSQEQSQDMKFKTFAPKMKRKVNWAMIMYAQWHALRAEDSPNLDKALNLEK